MIITLIITLTVNDCCINGCAIDCWWLLDWWWFQLPCNNKPVERGFITASSSSSSNLTFCLLTTLLNPPHIVRYPKKYLTIEIIVLVAQVAALPHRGQKRTRKSQNHPGNFFCFSHYEGFLSMFDWLFSIISVTLGILKIIQITHRLSDLKHVSHRILHRSSLALLLWLWVWHMSTTTTTTTTTTTAAATASAVSGVLYVVSWLPLQWLTWVYLAGTVVRRCTFHN